MRPNVSAWLVHATKNADEAKTKVEAALAWDKAGGGKPIVTDIRETFVLAEVREGRTPFTGLWHKSTMVLAGVSFEVLKEGAIVPVKLRVQEAVVQGSRAVIRFKAAT
jgi:hypothetical protein